MKKTLAVTLLLALLMTLPATCPAHAADQDPSHDPSVSSAEDRGAGYLPYSDPKPLGSGGLFGAVARTIFSLAIVLGLLYVTLWVIRKFTGGSTGPLSESSLRVVGRVYLSPKAVVYFLKLVDELLVVGVNAGGISLLSTIKDEQRMAAIEQALKGAQMPAPRFSRFFDRSMQRFQKPLERDEAGFDEQLRGIDEHISRLKGLSRRRQGDEE